jgi:phage tail-like protein
MDPLENFKFRVKWDGRYVAGVSKVSALRRTTEVVLHREGGEPSTMHEAPGRTTYEPITLERGITSDIAFEQWANLVSGPGGAADAKFRKDVILDVFDEAGQRVLSYRIYRCWVSEYQALPDLDADANAVAIEHIKLENEGWERDTSIAWPA